MLVQRPCGTCQQILHQQPAQHLGHRLVAEEACQAVDEDVAGQELPHAQQAQYALHSTM